MNFCCRTTVIICHDKEKKVRVVGYPCEIQHFPIFGWQSCHPATLSLKDKAVQASTRASGNIPPLLAISMSKLKCVGFADLTNKPFGISIAHL